MASEGPNSPGTITSAIFGTIAWTNPSNAGASDNSRAVCNHTALSISEYLWCANFGFSISGVVEGVLVEIEKRAQVIGPIHDHTIRLIIDGLVSGSSLADTVTQWPSSDAYVSHGGSAELWGTGGITAAQVNASNFGVAIASQNENATGSRNADIDHVRMTVFFTDSEESSSMFVQASEPLFMKPQRAEGYFRKRNRILIPT